MSTYPKLLYVTSSAATAATAPQAAAQAFNIGPAINITQISTSPYILVHAINISASATTGGIVAVYQKMQWQLQLLDCSIAPGATFQNRVMFGQNPNVQFTQPVRLKSAGLTSLFSLDVDCNGARAFVAGDSLFASVTLTYETASDDGAGGVNVSGTQQGIINVTKKSKFNFEAPLKA